MIIGLNGIAQSGKDTAGAYIVANYGYTRIAFADKVKECLAMLLDVDVSFIERHKNDDKEIIGLFSKSSFNMGGWIPHPNVKPFTIRHALQRVGTDVGRNILGQGLWVHLALEGINHNITNIVVTDVRFQNEIDYINKIGGEVWKIQRDVVENDSTVHEVHVSELHNQLTGISRTIPNNETLEDFYYDLDTAMTVHLKEVKRA